MFKIVSAFYVLTLIVLGACFEFIVRLLGMSPIYVFLTIQIVFVVVVFFMIYGSLYLPSAARAAREGQIGSFFLVVPCSGLSVFYDFDFHIKYLDLFDFSHRPSDDKMYVYLAIIATVVAGLVSAHVFSRAYRTLLIEFDPRYAVKAPGFIGFPWSR